ncbi:condensation domain-containing protein [Leptolyngbya sp. Heron Island J]|uniref:condensation domain-containing protein n=1 Tax=Leptolyngbya sp. Heron Island J TaxID=1385935 RepID=UPI000421C046|nr:condensation domain-containing protein [Leptolyngbya sp. Heron Island J]
MASTPQPAIAQQPKRSQLAALLKSHLPHPNQFPLSFAQQRLWFLDQLQPGNPAYTMMAAVRLRGDLDGLALKRAWQDLVQRHESLRTRFVLVDGQPCQRVQPTGAVSFTQLDWLDSPPADETAAIQAQALELMQQPFDLERDGLVRSHLIRLEANTHVLLLTLHHIISDGWSMEVLIRELAILYDAHQRGQPPQLPPLPIQYADFAVWQRQFLQGQVLEGQLSYWRSQLSPAMLPSLPTDFSRPAVRSHRGHRHSLGISPAVTTQLQALSQQANATLFMTTLAAFQVLLYDYAQGAAIRVGTPIANRDRPEVANLIGFFTNTLVLCADIDSDLTFRQWLQRVRDEAVNAYAHQDVPFEKLVDELQPERNLSQTPLYQVWFYLQDDPVTAVSFPGLTLEPIEIDLGTAKHDLKLGLWKSPQGVQGALEYSTDLFESATIARLARGYEDLLVEIARDPEQSIATLVQHLRQRQQQQQLEQKRVLLSTQRQKLRGTRRQTFTS